MGSPAFNFSRNLDFLNQAGSLGFKVAGTVDQQVGVALLKDTPFPDRTIRFGDMKLEASTASPIVFSRQGGDKISFSAKGGAFAGAGVYVNASELLKDLPAGQFASPALDFEAAPGDFLAAIRWGYDASATASGAMALGAAGSATIQAQASGDGLFAVVRRLPKSTGARTLIQSVADSWLLPRQIRSVEDLAPGTWLLAEVLGSVQVKLGAALGYDFNWVREVGLGQLKGDIGLRVQLGLATAIGFKAAGRCMVVVSRESGEKTLRLRVLRVKSRQLDFALNAAAAVKAVDTLLPRDADDLVKAVFGVHGEQILKDIAVVQKWTDVKKPLPELLAAAGVDGAEELIARIAGIEVSELAARVDEALNRVAEFTRKWEDLPHTVSSAILRLASGKPAIAEVKEIAAALAAADKAALERLLKERLSRIDFPSTPAGQLIEAIANGPALALLLKPLTEVKSVAEKVLGVLDGSEMESVLARFQSYLEERLNLEAILQPLSKASFKTLDGLLRKRLADFLGKQNLDFEDLDRIRGAINVVIGRRQEFYEKALEAIHRRYTFDLAYAFQKSSENQALLDATFDFSQDPAGVRTFFEHALAGNFDFVFTNHHPRVKLNLAELSHNIRRQSHTDVTLPFMSRSMGHMNDSLATARVEEQDGRVVAYRLETSDKVANNQRTSVLSLSMALSAAGFEAGQVRVHQKKLDLTYSSVFVRRDMTRKQLASALEPIAVACFPNQLKDLDHYVDFIDRRTEEAIPATPTTLGNGVVALQAVLPEGAAAAAGACWLALPSDKKDRVYRDMSMAIQMRLKKLLHESYFTEPERYHNLVPAQVLLAYCSMPPRVDAGMSNPPYWDTANEQEISAMLGKDQTVKKMQDLLKKAEALLKDTGDAGQYKPRDAGRILGSVSPRDPRLRGLLFVEFEIISHAFQAGLKMAQFKEKSAKPQGAVVALAEFGAKLTTAFNQEVVNMYVGDSVRAIGTALFLAATRAIAPPHLAAALSGASALLTIEFAKPGAPFDTQAVLNKGRLPDGLAVVSESVAEIV
jgi:hypothetical protein